MAWIDGGGGREGAQEMLEASDECPVVSAGEVCAADGQLEEAVAGEEHVLCLAIETDTAGRVAGTRNHLQRMCAEGDGRFLRERFAGRGLLAMERHAEEVFILPAETVQEG